MQERRTSKRRIVTMNEDRDGDALGIAIFLTPDQLTQLGLDPETTDVGEYWVEDGELKLRTSV